MSSFIDLTGQTFGRLTVLERVENGTRGNAQWSCRCVCGSRVTTQGGHLRTGHTVSCGCQRVGLRRPDNRAQTLSYKHAHQRVGRDRGKASAQSCVNCGEQAAEWAYMHTDPDELTAEWPDWSGNLRTVTYSVNPEHYAPMCHSCHLSYDKTRG